MEKKRSHRLRGFSVILILGSVVIYFLSDDNVHGGMALTAGIGAPLFIVGWILLIIDLIVSALRNK